MEFKQVLCILVDILFIYTAVMIGYYEYKVQKESFEVKAKVVGYKKIQGSRKHLTVVVFSLEDGIKVKSYTAPSFKESEKIKQGTEVLVISKLNNKTGRYNSRIRSKNKSILISNVLCMIILLIISGVITLFSFM